MTRGTRGEVERQLGQATARAAGSIIRPQRVADHRRVLVQLLLHEVAEIALADRGAGERGLLHLARHRRAVGVEEARLVARRRTAQSPSSR